MNDRWRTDLRDLLQKSVDELLHAGVPGEDIAAVIIDSLPRLVDRRRAHREVERALDASDVPDLERAVTKPFPRQPHDGFEQLAIDAPDDSDQPASLHGYAIKSA